MECPEALSGPLCRVLTPEVGGGCAQGASAVVTWLAALPLDAAEEPDADDARSSDDEVFFGELDAERPRSAAPAMGVGTAARPSTSQVRSPRVFPPVATRSRTTRAESNLTSLTMHEVALLCPHGKDRDSSGGQGPEEHCTLYSQQFAAVDCRRTHACTFGSSSPPGPFLLGGSRKVLNARNRSSQAHRRAVPCRVGCRRAWLSPVCGRLVSPSFAYPRCDSYPG